MRGLILCSVWVLMSFPAVALAGKADVLKVQVTQQGDSYRFDVTVAHEDTGWDHYADAWEVVGPDGKVLGVRTLFHPHVDEQPFTRSLSGVKIPAGVDQVTVRAHDKVDGWGGAEATVKIPR
ncbi:hypothetical protein EOI86_08525 [Hwanghaeella grinnelliae]|uniref:Uncharacterized protein n=1 Tax=Hwanghaeella grinnelliae TaxID=2500179 RepID=A0A437QXN1_9PROT|nr:hypothetical protein [Hwanghaeella grinnelliae]RVU39272.1 hypothetical protein EOI86_08525 [Hwanghaeella grinnelliae]